MLPWSADRELELACKVGSLPDLERALAEGANVNADGGSPLFVALMKGRKNIVVRLIEAGANPGMFLPKGRLARLQGREQIVAALLECIPPPPEEETETPAPVAGEEDGKALDLQLGASEEE